MFLWILGTTTSLIALYLGLVWLAGKLDTYEYNNGVCRDCGELWELEKAWHNHNDLVCGSGKHTMISCEPVGTPPDPELMRYINKR